MLTEMVLGLEIKNFCGIQIPLKLVTAVNVCLDDFACVQCVYMHVFLHTSV